MKNRIIIGIIFLATFLRFYNYENRWALAYDQAWFAVIGRYAVDTFQLPLLGPFASGGPFQTGGEWFWIVMIGTIMNRSWVLSPWIFITFLSIFQVYLLYVLGCKFKNKNFGYILAILGAVSTSQSLQATNLTSQMTASLCATVFLIALILYIKEKKLRYLFFQALFVGLSSAIHLQGILLLPALFIGLILSKSFAVKKLGLVAIGLAIPWVPVLIVDVQHGFFNTKNMLMYTIQPQSQIPYEALGRRWLTFLLEYIPSSWARIIGGFSIIGYLELVIVGIMLLIQAIKKKLPVEMWIVAISTLVITIILRYIRTPLFENYITFMHPFVFLLVGWVIYSIFTKSKPLGFVVLTILVFSSSFVTLQDVSHSTNDTARETTRYVEVLKRKYPGKKFAIYDYKYGYTYKSLPLTLYLQTENLISDDGIRIGMTVASIGAQKIFVPHKSIDGEVGAYQLFELSASSSADLGVAQWAFINPSQVYKSVEDWWRN